MEDGSFLIPFMSVMGLILMSAFFSGSETGMTSVSREKIHKLKMEGNKRAVILSQLREDKERLIGAILLGNNVVNIGASAIATALAIRYVGESGVIYATAVMTVLVLVFAEVLPKTYAVRHAESVALFVAPVFVLVTKVLSPLTNAVQVVVNSTLNLLSSETTESMTGVEVLRGAVDMYHEDGEMLKDDKDMLSGILNLDATLIEDVMVHRSEMASISIDEPAAKIVKFMANSSHTRIPVWKDAPDKIVGILHAKDILRAIEKLDGKKNTLDINLLLRKPWFVPESTTLKNQLKVFRENQKHFALVVDEFGSITGLVTLEDIIEEIVGEIEDEHDKPNQPRIKKGRGGTFNVDGDVSIRDLNRGLDWNMSDINATTVAGVVLQAAQGIPDVGDIFEVDEFMLKVLKRSGTQITRIQIRKIEESDS
jgi:Mg2+/Co2+ transporter CorB